MPEKIALLVSDIHLSHSPPLARSGEPDWYEAMARPLRELRDLADESLKLPVLCGGDVFDKWNCPPKLITFAMQTLPDNFNSVMGQHDLPYHSWEHRVSSAFWTLKEAGSVDLISKRRRVDGGVCWRGFQWGEEIENIVEKTNQMMTVCVAHQYVWWGHARDSIVATEKNRVEGSLGKLQGYDVALFGDNHKGFLTSRPSCRVFNAGTLMRRHADERDYKPMVGVLYDDDSVKPYYLDMSRDVFDTSESVREAEQVMLNLDSFLDEMQKLGGTGLDFRRAVETTMDREQVSRAVRRVILDAMEKGGEKL